MVVCYIDNIIQPSEKKPNQIKTEKSNWNKNLELFKLSEGWWMYEMVKLDWFVGGKCGRYQAEIGTNELFSLFLVFTIWKFDLRFGELKHQNLF